MIYLYLEVMAKVKIFSYKKYFGNSSPLRISKTHFLHIWHDLGWACDTIHFKNHSIYLAKFWHILRFVLRRIFLVKFQNCLRAILFELLLLLRIIANFSTVFFFSIEPFSSILFLSSYCWLSFISLVIIVGTFNHIYQVVF